MRANLRDYRLKADYFGALTVGDRFLLPASELPRVSAKDVECILRFLQRERDDWKGERGVQVGEEFFDTGDVTLEDTRRAINELTDLRQCGDGLERRKRFPHGRVRHRWMPMVTT